MTDQIPELEQIIEHNQTLLKWAHRGKSRFIIYCDFINIFANKENQLIIFLDDLNGVIFQQLIY